MRPLLRVQNNNVLITKQIMSGIKNKKIGWEDLLTNLNIPASVIEYIDPDEQQNVLVAVRPRDLLNKNSDKMYYHYTHCEIHPSTMFGILASCMPFP